VTLRLCPLLSSWPRRKDSKSGVPLLAGRVPLFITERGAGEATCAANFGVLAEVGVLGGAGERRPLLDNVVGSPPLRDEAMAPADSTTFFQSFEYVTL
jgi:hypothetical protein